MYGAMLVLGARLDESGEPKRVLRTRLDGALEAYRGGLAKYAILCGGDNDAGHNEAAAMKRYLLARGMPEQAILLEPRSRTTRANLQFAKAILLELGAGPALVVTTSWHIPRVKYNARQLGMALEYIGVPPPFTPGAVKMLLREAAAMAVSLYRFPMRGGKLKPGRYYKNVERKGCEAGPMEPKVFWGRQQTPEPLSPGASGKRLAQGGAGALSELHMQPGASIRRPSGERGLLCFVAAGAARFGGPESGYELFAGDSIAIPAGGEYVAECLLPDTLLLEFCAES